jgi:hypothetical protein
MRMRTDFMLLVHEWGSPAYMLLPSVMAAILNVKCHY